MNQAAHFDQLIQPLINLLGQFLRGELDQPDFQEQFKAALHIYETRVGSRGYLPLDTVADPEQHNLPHYTKYCKEALERLPKEALDRSTRQWAETTLVEDDGKFSSFRFTDKTGVSLFGACKMLYSTPVDEMSFLLSGMNGTIVRSSFDYKQLLKALRNNNVNELATWIYGTEPDGAFAHIDSIWSLGDVYSELYHLRKFEQSPSPEGGNSYLMLTPKSKAWMLLHSYDSEIFKIELHGNPKLIENIFSAL